MTDRLRADLEATLEDVQAALRGYDAGKPNAVYFYTGRALGGLSRISADLMGGRHADELAQAAEVCGDRDGGGG